MSKFTTGYELRGRPPSNNLQERARPERGLMYAGANQPPVAELIDSHHRNVVIGRHCSRYNFPPA